MKKLWILGVLFFSTFLLGMDKNSRKLEIQKKLISLGQQAIVMGWENCFREIIGNVLFDKNMPNEEQETLLINIAKWNRDEKYINYLVDDEKCNVNCQDSLGKSALHYAASNERLEIMKKLIDRGALINQQDHDGQTPLFELFTGPQLERSTSCYTLLIEHNADVTIRDKDGRTFVHNLVYITSFENNDEMAVLYYVIPKTTAILYMTDNDGQSVVSYAYKFKQELQQAISKPLLELLDNDIETEIKENEIFTMKRQQFYALKRLWYLCGLLGDCTKNADANGSASNKN